tara:strand:- start:550 stop:1668 length:1119 start_codon:yes stop_codon:yes gene_type:complete
LKKVIIISPAYPLRGGISESTELLYLEYLKKGVDCQIISYNLQYPKFLFPGKKQTISDSEKKNFNIISLLNSINPISWYRTSKYINLQKPDYVIFRFWNPFFSFCLGFLALFLNDIKKVGWIDNVFPHRKIPFQKNLIKFFLKKMDAFIVMSESVKNDLNKFKINAPVHKSLHPLYNNFGVMLDKKLARSKLKVAPNYNYILFFGFIRKYKGLDFLIEAMSNKLINERKIKLIIAGEFYENEKYYKQKIHDLNLSKSIIIFDHYINNNEVSKYFCAADIVVQPYLSATQSGISMIALHFNRPVLATNVGGLSDYIKNNQNGYLIEPNSKKIVDSLLDFFDNKKSKFFEENIKLMKKQYSWSNLVNSFESIFK